MQNNFNDIRKLIFFDPIINIRFERTTFKTGYRENVLKIRKLIIFDKKYLKSRIWTPIFQKPMSDFKQAPSNWGTCEISLRQES